MEMYPCYGPNNEIYKLTPKEKNKMEISIEFIWVKGPHRGEKSSMDLDDTTEFRPDDNIRVTKITDVSPPMAPIATTPLPHPPTQQHLFKEAAKPLVEYLNDNYNPHAIVIVSQTGAEILDGKCKVDIPEYLKD